MLRYGFRLLPFVFALQLWGMAPAPPSFTYKLGFCLGKGVVLSSSDTCPKESFVEAKNAVAIAVSINAKIKSDPKLKGLTAKAVGRFQVVISCGPNAACPQKTVDDLAESMAPDVSLTLPAVITEVTYKLGLCDGTAVAYTGAAPCPPPKFEPAQNAASVATILAKTISKFKDGSQNTVTAKVDDDNRIVIACSGAAGCTPTVLDDLKKAMTESIKRFAVREPAYGDAQTVSDRIKVFYPQIDAQPVKDGRFIELASMSPLTPRQRDDIRGIIRTSFGAVAIPLPVFCLSGTLDGPPPRLAAGGTCGGQTPVPACNASDIASLLTNDTVTVKPGAKAPNQLSITCKGGCRQSDLDWIRESILELAWPIPAYVQDVEVPLGDASAAAKAITDGNKALAVTADAIGPAKIRLKSDSPVSQTDVNSIVDTYVFGGSAPPSFRMFYQDAPTVLKALTPPPDPTAAAKAATAAASSPAPAVKPPASTDPTAADPNAVQFKTEFDTTTSVKDASAKKPADNATPTPPPAADPAKAPKSAAKNTSGTDGSADTKATPDTTTKTTSTVTYTPPPAKKSDPPSPPPVGAGMSAVNDNVVFTDTTNEALIWQRIRLLTILDLPRPEVLMNMWSYEASSPDGNETLKSSEKLRDLVTAYNDALENSIGYGWAYLSRQMKAEPLNLPEASALPLPCPEPSCPAIPPQPASQMRLSVGLNGSIGPAGPVDQADLLYPMRTFFDPDFYNYITQKFVADTRHCADPDCDPGSPFPNSERTKWGFCPQGKYCLGYTQAFEPVRPNLTSILLAAIAAKYPLKAILTTIGCMEGKYEVYGNECFPDRQAIAKAINDVKKSACLADAGCLESKRRIQKNDGGGDGCPTSKQLSQDNNNCSDGDGCPKSKRRSGSKSDGAGDGCPTSKQLSQDNNSGSGDGCPTSNQQSQYNNCGDADRRPKSKLRNGTPNSTPAKELRRQMREEDKDAKLQHQIHELEQLALQIEQARDARCTDCPTNLGESLKSVRNAIESLRLTLECPECKGTKTAGDLTFDSDGAHFDDHQYYGYEKEVDRQRACLIRERGKRLREKRYRDELSCEKLDTIALEAQESCGLAQTFPLSCFTIQAAQSFSSPAEFSTFSLQDLNNLAETRLADLPVPEGGLPGSPYSAPRVGLLRAAVADFLFNYKMSQEFPKEFVPYDLQHSAQELNAELNPLVVAFNEDVAAFSRNLQNKMEGVSPNQTSFFQLWRNHKSFISDGIITVRGIGGDQSTVDTVTQNYFDATQPQSLTDIVNALTGQGGSGASPITGLESGASAATVLPAVAALLPKPTQAKIGRELYLQITPHTLPGASSAELDVTLKADESGEPSLYQSGTNVGTDNLSRVARHDVTTKVRVESVKLFELSSFSALLQRPRAKLPLVPPLVQLPWIGSLASLPLPGAREYHRSTAIVSAVIVPTAADLAYGIDFSHDRFIPREEPFSYGHGFQMRSIKSFSELGRAPIRAFHKAMTVCFATNGLLTVPPGVQFQPATAGETCHNLTFRSVPPEF
jgi:hypothetical protein